MNDDSTNNTSNANTNATTPMTLAQMRSEHAILASQQSPRPIGISTLRDFTARPFDLVIGALTMIITNLSPYWGWKRGNGAAGTPRILDREDTEVMRLRTDEESHARQAARHSLSTQAMDSPIIDGELETSIKNRAISAIIHAVWVVELDLTEKAIKDWIVSRDIATQHHKLIFQVWAKACKDNKRRCQNEIRLHQQKSRTFREEVACSEGYGRRCKRTVLSRGLGRRSSVHCQLVSLCG